MNKFAHAVLAIALTGIGMAGLYFNVENSGWVMAVGLLVALAI